MFSSPSSLLTVPFLLTETMGETSAHYYYLYHLIALTPLKSPFPPTSEAVLPVLLSRAMTKFPGTLARRETSFHGGPWESRRQCPGNEGSPGNTAKQPEAAKFSLPPSFQAGQVAVRKPAKSQRRKRAQVKASLQNGCQVVSPPRKQFATIRMKLKICYEPQAPCQHSGTSHRESSETPLPGFKGTYHGWWHPTQNTKLGQHDIDAGTHPLWQVHT